MIVKVGDLVEHITAAVEQHGCKRTTDIIVRIGNLGAEYRIDMLKGMEDQRGFHLLIQLCAVPENG